MHGGEEAFFFEAEFLDHERVGGGDFEHAAAEDADLGDRSELGAGGFAPGLVPLGGDPHSKDTTWQQPAYASTSTGVPF